MSLNQRKQNIIKKYRILDKNKIKSLINIDAILKIDSIDSTFYMFLYVSSSLISYANIVLFSVRIFRNLDLEIECVLRCKAMELELIRCIVSRLERVVVVRPSYVLFSLETQCPKELLNIYIRTFV